MCYKIVTAGRRSKGQTLSGAHTHTDTRIHTRSHRYSLKIITHRNVFLDYCRMATGSFHDTNSKCKNITDHTCHRFSSEVQKRKGHNRRKRSVDALITQKSPPPKTRVCDLGTEMAPRWDENPRAGVTRRRRPPGLTLTYHLVHFSFPL